MATQPTFQPLDEGQQPVQEIRVMLVTEKQEWHDAIYGYLTGNPRYHIVLLGWYTRLPLLMAALRTYRPEVVLVDYDTPGLSTRAVESIYAAVGATCLGLAPRGDSAAGAAMRDMGCVDSHCPPFDTDELVLKIQMAHVRAEQLARAAKSPMAREVRDQVQVIKDRIITFHSRAGGVGKSTMARETAATLALIGHHPTVLVDFCATGSIQFRLFPFTDQDRRHNLFRLCLNASVEMEDPALNELVRQNLLIYRRHGNHEGELNLLFAPPLDEQWIDESLRQPRLFTRILELLARLYTFVVVDIGQDLNLPSHAAALMKTDLVALVTTPSPQTVEMLAEGLPDLARLVDAGRKLRFVTNKVEEGVGLSGGQIKAMLDNLPQLGEVPLATAEVESSRMERRPAMLSDRSTPFTVAVSEMVRKLAPLPEVYVPKQRFGLFKRK